MAGRKKPKQRKQTRQRRQTKNSSASYASSASLPRACPERSRRAKSRGSASLPYEFLDHPADVGFRARGRTLPELFAHAAQAMLDYGWDTATIRPRKRVPLKATGADLESLLYNWLSEILSRADAEGWAFRKAIVHRINVHREPYEVRGTMLGERFVRTRHRARTYLKAVTYHQLAVQKTPAGWEAIVYLDV